MLTDTGTADAIRSALTFDPRIPSPDEIAVAIEGSVVTLRGTVGSFRQRRAAVADVREVDGIDELVDDLKVRLLDESRREDAEIRGIALQWLMWDIWVPSQSIDVEVSDGWLTLTGQVTYQFESDAAFEDLASLIGVVGITNEIKVTTP